MCVYWFEHVELHASPGKTYIETDKIITVYFIKHFFCLWVQYLKIIADLDPVRHQHTPLWLHDIDLSLRPVNPQRQHNTIYYVLHIIFCTIS